MERAKPLIGDYYTNKHYPILKNILVILSNLCNRQRRIKWHTNTPVPYVAIVYLYFENVKAFQDVMKRNGAEIMADIPKYTNISPVVQIIEVVQQIVLAKKKFGIFTF